MDEKSKEARRIYIREWQRANKDKVQAAQLRYWKKKALQLELQDSGSQKPANGFYD